MKRGAWLEERERGNLFVIRLSVRLARVLGRRGMRPIVSLVALFYWVFDRRARRASRAWLQRIHGAPVSGWRVYRHLRKFAQVTCDRFFLAAGDFRPFEIVRHGSEHFQGLMDRGQGAVLLGAHLGSYEAMRARSAAARMQVKVLGYFENARAINALLTELDPGGAAELIHIGADPMNATLRAQAAVARGEFVAIHADRVGLSSSTIAVPFLGELAHFPTGPFLLAALLRAPVYVVFGLYHEPNRYELFCEPFAPRLEIPRKDRRGALERIVQQYVAVLERRCREAPDNWFNFFDFWEAPRVEPAAIPPETVGGEPPSRSAAPVD